MSLNPEVGGLVSGYGLSRAANREHSEGFSPCLFRQGEKDSRVGPAIAGAKAQQMHPFGTAEAVP